MEKRRGRFSWYQVNATDAAAAREFYCDVAGWQAQDIAMQDGSNYIMLGTDHGPIGGIMSLPDEARKAGAPQHWLSYVTTPDIDATLMQARDHDAQVYVPPTELSDGRFAVLADPQGALFALFTPNVVDEDTPFAPQPGDISWHELMTTDHKAALAFYQELFGWEKLGAHDMGDMGIYQEFGRQGVALGGMYDKPPELQAPSHWLLYIMVPNVEERIERITELGGKVLRGPMEVPGGDLVAQCLDPQGGVFAIHATAQS
ncbi:MAG: VOC family protein [Gammaproteobacteria bacterium]|nr:VOC family protein [Gammaproteobacteria bacterium]